MGRSPPHKGEGIAPRLEFKAGALPGRGGIPSPLGGGLGWG